jgi:hypothetical protein
MKEQRTPKKVINPLTDVRSGTLVEAISRVDLNPKGGLELMPKATPSGTSSPTACSGSSVPGSLTSKVIEPTRAVGRSRLVTAGSSD